MKEILEIARQNQQKAFEVIRKTKLIEAWESIGAEVNLVGSLKTGLLMKHRDIDFHVYTSSLNISESFRAVSLLAENSRIVRIEYSNLIDTDEKCIEWHAWYCDENDETWQIDMIHILKGSYYDGYFERMAERINEVITRQQRECILRLKYETPDGEKIPGVEYYVAVIRDNVNNYLDFEAWRGKYSTGRIIEWIP